MSSDSTMQTSPSEERPSARLHQMAAELRLEPKPLAALIAVGGQRQGPLLIALLLALPFPLPGSLPGFGMVFGVMIALLGIVLVTGRLRWPASILWARPIGGAMVAKILGFGAGFLARLERLGRPRLGWLAEGPLNRRLVGAGVVFLGLVLALPLPPGTNSPPAIGIILLTLGALLRDGLMVGGGYLVALINAGGLVALGVFGVEGTKLILASFSS